MDDRDRITDDFRDETYPSGLTQVTAERSILATLMHQSDALWDYPTLSADVFTVPAHQLIFNILKALVQADLAADVVAVYDALTSSNKLEAVGGVVELFTLADETHLSHYLPTLVKRALTGRKGRELLNLCSQVAAGLATQTLDADQAMEQLEKGLIDIPQGTMTIQLHCGNKPLGEAYAALDPDHEGDDTIPLGLPGLQRKINGLCGGEVMVVGARPGVGKTAYALQLIRSCLDAKRSKLLLISLEMQRQSVYQRLWSAYTGIPGWRFRSKALTQDHRAAINTVSGKLGASDLHVVDSRGLNALEIVSLMRRLHGKLGGLDAVVVDYLQLVTYHGDPRTPRHIQVGETLRMLRNVAGALDVPLVVLAQLNRGIEYRKGDEPGLADLRESGDIEQDADVVLFLHRSGDVDSANVDSPEAPPLAEVRFIIAKQREGGRGYLDTLFNGHTGVFGEVVKEYGAHPANLEDQSQMQRHYGVMAEETKNGYDHAVI